MYDFLGCKLILPGRVQPLIHQYQVLLVRATLSPNFSACINKPGVIPTQVKDLVLDLVDLYEFRLGPFLELVQVPLDITLSFRCVKFTILAWWCLETQ
ncbi:hypothetical protein WISP_115594 [Willisornis vidua]|uniref:Uncharacterized protein n=1 Tax=Willisornis vidua TaxID=1566151 RepID=A0ABQ9CV54_9PASS|nr:hypothetical protein WISP_115594 [Willisornis vidua]